jgi:hypothetical protein
MKHIIILMIILNMAIQFAHSQTRFVSGVIEIQNTIQYSYFNENKNNMRPIFYRKSHDVAIQPSIGCFIFNNMEVILQPRFSFQYLEINYYMCVSSSGDLIEVIDRTYIYHPGVCLGFVFHQALSEYCYSFIGLTGGISWFKKHNYSNHTYIWEWSNPEWIFPSFAVGCKFFVTDQWALFPQFQYDYKTYLEGKRDDSEAKIFYGIGICFYLNRKNGG